MRVQCIAVLLAVCVSTVASVAIHNQGVEQHRDIDPIRYSIKLSKDEYEADEKSNIQSRSISMLQKLHDFNIYKSFAPFAAHSERRMHERHRHNPHTRPHWRHRHHHRCKQENVYSSTPKVTTESIPGLRPVTQEQVEHAINDPTTRRPSKKPITTTSTSTTTPRYNDPDNELVDPIDLRFGSD